MSFLVYMSHHSRHAELQSKLENALKELSSMKEARDRQAYMVEAIVKQRDQYKMLLANAPTMVCKIKFWFQNEKTYFFCETGHFSDQCRYRLGEVVEGELGELSLFLW